MDQGFYAAEVDRHVAWARIPNGPTPQRARLDSGSAEVVFLAHEQMLTFLAGDDEGDAERGTWVWGATDRGKDVFEFTIPYGAQPTDEQRKMVHAHLKAMGTWLPHRVQEPDW